MIRFELIAADLRQHGPSTTRDIAARMDLPLKKASSWVSHAKSYGYIKVVGARAVTRPHGGATELIYAVRDGAPPMLRSAENGPRMNLWGTANVPG